MLEVEQQTIGVFTEKAYLDYAMYVILDRALPNIGDGLKPVQRRIIYAMSELNLSSQAKYKKSARTVGDVLGKFHPHGDSACYEAMVLMAQSFSYRYPLVDGQGNWGTADDPKSFAAMRYTESRLSSYADLLLSELGQGTSEWVSNFDGTLLEPEILPARLPNLLLNGTTGIAVGMATDIPPHNLTEVVKACIEILDKANPTFADVFKHIKGPDYPTASEVITAPADIQSIYKTGHGSIKCRALYKIDNGEIVIYGLPYLVSGAKVIEQIAGQMQAKKLPFVNDLRDDSDHENPTRIVIVPKAGKIDVDNLMTHLFATTDLERSYKVNLNVIGLNGKPKVKNILEILQEWLEYRKQTVTRRLQYRLDKILARIHILDGLLIAFVNIDEIINLIRNEDEPKDKLMRKYSLSIEQAEAILDLKLRNLAKLEETKIRGEQQELSEERLSLEELLSSSDKLKNLIKSELTADLNKYKDPRKSILVQREESKAINMIAQAPSSQATVVLSAKGWVRSGKGHEFALASLTYKTGDEYLGHVLVMTDDNVSFFTSDGKVYSLAVNSLPSARGYGDPLTSKLVLEPGAFFKSMLVPGSNYLLASVQGYGFIAEHAELVASTKKGKAIINISAGAELLNPSQLTADLPVDKLKVVLITSDARLLVCSLADVPVMSKGRGKKLITLSGEAKLLKIVIMSAKNKLKLSFNKKVLELTSVDLKAYIGEIGARATKLPKGYQTITDIAVIAK